jgi:hypothetical protein
MDISFCIWPHQPQTFSFLHFIYISKWASLACLSRIFSQIVCNLRLRCIETWLINVNTHLNEYFISSSFQYPLILTSVNTDHNNKIIFNTSQKEALLRESKRMSEWVSEWVWGAKRRKMIKIAKTMLLASHYDGMEHISKR